MRFADETAVGCLRRFLIDIILNRIEMRLQSKDFFSKLVSSSQFYFTAASGYQVGAIWVLFDGRPGEKLLKMNQFTKAG